MNNEQIRKIALLYGFKLKEQPGGEMDLNPYVYDFARALMVLKDSNEFKSLPLTSSEVSHTETWVDGHRYIENDDGRNDLDPDCIAEEYRRQMDKDDD